MPSDIIIHHWSIAYELFTYWSLLSYFSVATVTIATKLLLLLLLLLPLLPYYFATKYFTKDSFTSCSFVFERRIFNFEAHNLAKFACNLDIGRYVWLGTFHDPRRVPMNIVMNQ